MRKALILDDAWPVTASLHNHLLHLPRSAKYPASLFPSSMAALRHRVANPLRLLKHRPWRSSTAIAPRLHNSQLVEEELAPYYDPSRFYPARLGEVLNGRYQLATKLGHGASSTVWLARGLNQYISQLMYIVIYIGFYFT